ncbi:hypothetical protein V6N12_014455 [Hibiscus sabdariffa]|uniref:Uncharacterized protein n=1 Tax=Hibiscus sabdariffa TaxID=183260 RepID=A0ABR2DN39_9ROSI
MLLEVDNLAGVSVNTQVKCFVLYVVLQHEQVVCINHCFREGNRLAGRRYGCFGCMFGNGVFMVPSDEALHDMLKE